MIRKISDKIVKLYLLLQKKNQTIVNVNSSIREVLILPPANLKDIESKWHPPVWYAKYNVNAHRYIKSSNSYITEDGVIFEGNQLIKESLVYPHFENRFSLNYFIKKFNFFSVKKTDRIILIWNHWGVNNYYHWMIDALSNLIMLESNEFIHYKLLIPKNAPAFVYDSLKCFDYALFEFPDKNLVRCNDLIYPLPPTFSGVSDKFLIKKIRDKLIKFSNKYTDQLLKFEKVYVSRSQQKLRKIIGEEKLIEMLEQRDFKIIYFEDFSFWEQIELMKNANFLITSHGANMVNMLVMKDKSKIIEVNMEDTQQATLCYWNLASILDFDYNYIPAKFDGVHFLMTDEILKLIDKQINVEF